MPLSLRRLSIREDRSRGRTGAPQQHTGCWDCLPRAVITRLTFRSSLSANAMMPSKIITLAPYRVFCGGRIDAVRVQIPHSRKKNQKTKKKTEERPAPSLFPRLWGD